MVSPRWALILLLVCSLAGCKKKEEARRAQRAGEVLHPYESRKAGVGEPLQPDVPRKAGAGESTHPNVGLKAGEDRPARPAILATPPSKNTGAPPWASSQAAVHPQPVKPSEIFDALRLAPVKGAEAKDVVVICRAKAKGRFDAFRGPDITLTVKLDDGRRVTFRGPENSYTAYMALRLRSLKSGEKLSISAYDRDATGSEHIGSRELTYAGAFPLEVTAPHLDLICRAASRESAEALVKDEEKVTARLLRGAAATLKPQPGQRDWGAGRTVLPRLRAQIMTEAALVGWSSPRVQGHLRRLAAVQEKWDRLAAASVEKTLVLLPAKGTELALKADEISVKVTTFSCEGGERCLLQLMARNNGAKAKTCSSVTSWLGGVRKAALVRADGKMVELKIQECRVKGRGKVSRVQPGEEATVKLGIGRRGLAKGPRPERIKMLWLSDFLARKVDLLRL